MAEVKQVLCTHNHTQTHSHLVCVWIMCVRMHPLHTHKRAHHMKTLIEGGSCCLILPGSCSYSTLVLVPYFTSRPEDHTEYTMTESETGWLFDDKLSLSNCTYLPMLLTLARGCQSYTWQPLRQACMINMKVNVDEATFLKLNQITPRTVNEGPVLTE